MDGSPRDEHPDSADLDAFGSETGYCPECGEEIWDSSEQCPSCGAWIAQVVSRPPVDRARRRLIGVAMLFAALCGFLLLSLCSVPR